MRKLTLLIILVVLCTVCLFSDYLFTNDLINSPVAQEKYHIIPMKNADFNQADIAWMLISSAFVLFMTPGLGFFYGGMVRKKNMISTILQSFIALGIMTIVWVVVGFSLAFGSDVGNLGIIGNPFDFAFFNNVGTVSAWEGAKTIPMLLFALFQMKFAIITPALVTGAFAERIKFWSYILFMVIFSLFVYAPLAHMTWHPEGIMFQKGILDFAGGTVVHMSAGWAALAGALILKKRAEPEHDPSRITYVILGTSMLWFGWFGFNAGSALGATPLAVQAFANTTIASAAAAIAWGFIEKIQGRKISGMGVCIGAVVGLVAITPACGYVTIPHSIFIGVIASAVSSFMVHLRTKTEIDDTLDVFPCHGVGGMVGMILTGVFASHAINPDVVKEQGLIYGEYSLFIKHFIALIGVSIFAFCSSWLILKFVDLISPLRVSEKNELLGLDITQHGESL